MLCVGRFVNRYGEKNEKRVKYKTEKNDGFYYRSRVRGHGK